jgi:mannosyltransferase OCH1-like enzyme
MLIPRLFHQIWVGPDPLPEEYARYQGTWLEHHPGWELRFWTEQNLPKLRRPEGGELLRAPAERTDIMRLEVLSQFGGVYVDADFECLRSIEPLIENANFFIGLAKPGRVNNALMGSVAGHPLLDRALKEIRPRTTYGMVDKEGTGPAFLDRLLAGEREDVLLLDPEVFYPRTQERKSGAYAVHHEARTWKDADLLRIDMQRAEQKMAKALQKAERWRVRCKAAETELNRLQRTWPARLSRLGRRLLRRARA